MEQFFTFGFGHYSPSGIALRNTVVAIPGTYGEARNKMVEVVGDKFAFQYNSAEDAGVERFNLSVISLEELKQLWEKQ